MGHVALSASVPSIEAGSSAPSVTSSCAPKSASRLTGATCAAARKNGQTWVLPPPGAAPAPIHLRDTYVEGLCLDVSVGATNAVRLVACSPSRKAQQRFEVKLAHGGGAQVEYVIQHSASGRCVNLNSHKQIDVWKCNNDALNGKGGSDRWVVDPKTGELRATGKAYALCLDACGGAAPGPTPPAPRPPPPPPPDAPVVLDSKYSPFVFAGVWAMSANGAARQLFEYSEPARSELCDLLFSPGMGTRWQGLKVEIGGDVESSYGSMGSYAHVADNTSWSFNRGDQWWLIKEARKRDPGLPLMALSWGMPGWVGNGTTLSEGGVDYHVQYLLGAKRVQNIDFQWIGIWNEAPWTPEYIQQLRAGLDAAGLHSVQITAADGSTDVISAAAANATLADAIGSFGIHTHLLAPNADINKWNGKKPYFNSENDLVDGAAPQFGLSMRSGLNWPLAFINNFLVANGTATMLCPAFHGWSMNLGRHNHGPAWFNDPWSGFYQLAAPFFGQAQFTQFSEIGWNFVESGVGNRGCQFDANGPVINHAGMPVCNLTFAALASPSGEEFSLIVVSLANSTQTLNVGLAGALSRFRGVPLQRWTTVETQYFSQGASVAVPKGSANLALKVPPLSVTTISNRKALGGWKNVTVPPRTRWPLPWTMPLEAQALEEPCRGANSIYGAFEVSIASGRKVCKQAVPANPAGNAWTHRRNGWPIATLPSGSNLANYEISVEAQPVAGAHQGTEPVGVSVCGRVPIWSPDACQGLEHFPGVCLAVFTNSSPPTWALTEVHSQYSIFGCKHTTTLASGTLPSSIAAIAAGGGGGAAPWLALKLSFSGAEVTASVGGTPLANATTLLPAGVAGFGSAWNVANFANVTIAPHPLHPVMPGSFVFDVLPSEVLLTNYSGHAGMIVDLTNGRVPPSFKPLALTRLGRFKSAGNKLAHTLGVLDATDLAAQQWVGENATVDLATCVTDALGFCYSAPLATPIEMVVGKRYLVVSSETTGEALVAMGKSATGADYSTYRDGDTLMTYKLPAFYGRNPGKPDRGKSFVSGKVMLDAAGTWIEQTTGPDLDTSYGPLNFVLRE